MPPRLMIPGPVPLLDSVSAEMGAPVQAHYGTEWVRLYNETISLLREIFGTHGDVFCLVGSGTAGLDAALGTLLSAKQHIVIGVSGFHSQRLAIMARAHGAQVSEVNVAWGKPITPEVLESAFASQLPPFAVAVTQVETTTGVLNPVRELAQLVREHNALMLVDAVGSLGGVEFAMEEWGVDICCTASQKCLGGAPGLAPVAVGERAWAAIEQRDSSPRSWYLDLTVWREAARDWAEWHPYPVTIPTNLILALRAGLKALVEDGISNRFAHYQRLAQRLRTGARELGMVPLVQDQYAAPVVTAIRSPEGIPSSQIVAFLESEHGIKISGGFGPLQNKIFRVGHMGPTITRDDIESVLGGLEAFMRLFSHAPTETEHKR
jgi:alanine-glyoxylate transaminase/serine-glyoxylate transaminase/serine-pyruvate transaminase